MNAFSKNMANKPLQVLLFMIIIAVVIRFPFIFRDYIDRDESTFIIMGQSWVDGNLPFTELWDLKPPLVFLFFAALIKLFGKSLVLIRLIGAIWVGLIGFMTYKITKRIQYGNLALYVGILSIYLTSLFGSLQGVMSEHLAVLPLLVGFYFVLHQLNYTNALLAGFFFGAGIMFRLNLGMALLPFLLIYTFWVLKDNFCHFKYLLVLGLSILIVPILIYLPYYIQGLHNLYVNSVIYAPLAYSKVSLVQCLKTLPILTIFVLIGFLAFRRNFNPQRKLLFVMIICLCAMLFKGGKINGHYLIQIFPFVVIPFVVLISKIPLKNPLYKRRKLIIICLLILAPVETYKEIKDVVQYYIHNNTLLNGEGYEIARWFENNYPNDKNVFFLNHHIGYWLMDAKPITKIVTHPSNLARESNYKYAGLARATPLDELNYILFEKRPSFIIVDMSRNPIRGDNELNHILQLALKEDYKPVDEIEKTVIYKRN